MDKHEEEELATIRQMPSTELVRLAIHEARRAALAELIHAREELKEELKEARMAAVCLGLAGLLGTCALAVGFVLIGLALPVSEPGGQAIAGGALAFAAGWLALIGFIKLPKKPMESTRKRLAELVDRATEELEHPPH